MEGLVWATPHERRDGERDDYIVLGNGLSAGVIE